MLCRVEGLHVGDTFRTLHTNREGVVLNDWQGHKRVFLSPLPGKKEEEKVLHAHVQVDVIERKER